jgi:hypothetical protein
MRALIAFGAAMLAAGCSESERIVEPVAQRPAGPRETCATRSMAEFPGAFTQRRNLVVGPLAMMGGAAFTTPETVREFGGNKFPLLVRNGHRVTVELGRGAARLGYGPLPQGKVETADGHRAVAFIACRTGSGSEADGEPVTFWSGFLLADKPQCVRLRVWVDREPAPRRAAVPLGKRC